ncbi:ABC transporter permease [Caldifermentibacillus hisashii]
MWKTLLFLFFFPMLALACIGFICMHILSEEVRVEKFQVAIVDQDDTKATNFIIQHLMDNEEITKLSKFIQVKESIANELMEKNQIVAIISLPHGFTKNIIKGDNTPVPVIVNPRKPVQSMLVLQLLESATKFTSAAQSGIELHRIRMFYYSFRNNWGWSYNPDHLLPNLAGEFGEVDSKLLGSFLPCR